MVYKEPSKANKEAINDESPIGDKVDRGLSTKAANDKHVDSMNIEFARNTLKNNSMMAIKITLQGKGHSRRSFLKFIQRETLLYTLYK